MGKFIIRYKTNKELKKIVDLIISEGLNATYFDEKIVDLGFQAVVDLTVPSISNDETTLETKETKKDT